MNMAVLKWIFLLSYWTFTEVMAKDSSVMLYQRKNSSVCLHVKNQSSMINLQWKFGTTFIISKTVINPQYQNRVFFSSENLTLCINKLTENDTGIYKATYLCNFEEVTESYQIIVQEMVPRPVMTVISETHSNLSAGFCNFTVNCSIQDDWLWSICDKNSCRTSQRSFSNLNITILTENSVVICSVNNHVSANNVSENIKTMCFVKSNIEHIKELQSTPNTLKVVIPIIVLVVIISVSLFIGFVMHLRKRKHDQETSVAQLIQSGPLEAQHPSERSVSTSSSSEADPSYENVETNQPQENSIPRDEQVFSESQSIDTIYSIPRKVVSCTKSDKRKDALGDENTQRTLTSGSVDVNKKQSPTQTETVYSVLQMPKNLNS